MKKLALRDLILLGMTNFALYVGAGNIIFPPYIGMLSGEGVTIAAIGFLLTGVGLPVIAAIALAKVGGVLGHITEPIGIKVGMFMTIVCYLAIGPFYAIPRTATVAYELAITPFYIEETGDTTGNNSMLLIYTLIYFVIAVTFALYPAKILDTVGKFLSPIKIFALVILCLTALVLAPSAPIEGIEPFKSQPLSQGIINGYLTLDTLASLAFGTVIVDAIRSRGVNDENAITKYATISGLMAGTGLTFIYICLFKLGNESYGIAPKAQNGAEILSAYVHYAFGPLGNIFLAMLIIVACLVTAIGLICACSAYFHKITGIGYGKFAFAIAIVSCGLSNLGLTQLIQVSVPVLIAIYPAFVVLVLASFFKKHFVNSIRVIAPTAILATLFGIVDGFDAAGIEVLPKAITDILPLYASDLAWLLPCTIVFFLMIIIDKAINKTKVA